MSAEDRLRRLAEHGESRGADTVLVAAREEVTTAGGGRSIGWPAGMALAAAAIAVAVVSAVALTGNRDETVTAGPPSTEGSATSVPSDGGSSTSSTVPPSEPVVLPQAAVVFDTERGLVRIEPDGEQTVIGGPAMDAGSRAQLSVDPTTGDIYTAVEASGCEASIERTTSDGTTETVVTGARSPAVDPTGTSLASVPVVDCRAAGGVVVVEDLADGSTVELDTNADADGLTNRVEDVAWMPSGRLLVLLEHLDGTAVGNSLVEYERTSDGFEFARQAVGMREDTDTQSSFEDWSAIAAIDAERVAVVATDNVQRFGDGGVTQENPRIDVVDLTDDSAGRRSSVVETLAELAGPVLDLAVAGDGTLLFTLGGDDPSGDRVYVQRPDEAPERVAEGASGVAWLPET